MIDNSPLPIETIWPALDQALSEPGNAVIIAPPGAGKTSRVPLRLLKASWLGDGKIIITEPRRLAARAAANRMAAELNEAVGERVGYRVRYDNVVSDKTRIIVVTEAIFTKMAVDDPELKGISAVIFDEFHERSLDVDFGLALALDIKSGLRPDLRLLVMSATLDGNNVAALLDRAPIIETTGRSFPVEIRYQPREPSLPIEQVMANNLMTISSREGGNILAFLPGQREIESCARLLAGKLANNILVTPLYGSLDLKSQNAAIEPAPEGQRKIVLATSIAESSLTIDDIHVVVDSGLARVPVFEPSTAITRLETHRASLASVNQRAGRAGRTRSGIAIRLWHRGQNQALKPFNLPEIQSADLSALVLDCAALGINDPSSLRFLDRPPFAALNEARQLLIRLGALDHENRITSNGLAMRKLNLPVRFAHMLIEAQKIQQGSAGALLALILSEKGLGGNSPDLEDRFANVLRDNSERAQKAKALARRLCGDDSPVQPIFRADLLFHAYPERLAQARRANGEFLLANGRAAFIDPMSPLAKASYLIVAELTGRAEQSRILSAAALDASVVAELLGAQRQTEDILRFDLKTKSLKANRVERYGALIFKNQPVALPSAEMANQALIKALREFGLTILPWTKETENLLNRLRWLHKIFGDPWPAMTDQVLIEEAETWLLPFLNGQSDFSELLPRKFHDALMMLVPFHLQGQLEQLAPLFFTAPTGSKIAIQYGGEQPTLSIRVQELFGLDHHPTIANNKVAIRLELLSPAHRALQLTTDLPGFWRGSWRDVLSVMRGRYPKHAWPDDPLKALPTRRTKRSTNAKDKKNDSDKL